MNFKAEISDWTASRATPTGCQPPIVRGCTEAEATKALVMNGTELDGRVLKVNVAENKPRRDFGGGGGGGGSRY